VFGFDLRSARLQAGILRRATNARLKAGATTTALNVETEAAAHKNYFGDAF
jgi:hypothetical protein